MQLERLHDETEFQHHKRIVYGKLIDKTLNDIDYTTLSKYLYGKEYSEDVARRMFYGSCRTLKLVDESTIRNISDDDVMNEVEMKIHELKRESQKCRDQRRELNKMLSSEGRFEYMCDKLADAAKYLNNTMPLITTSVGEVDSRNEAILVLTDWHYGLVTSNVANEYDVDICNRRVDYVINKAIERIKLHNCRKLHVIILGDMIHGAIHTSARVASEELTCEQLMHVSELIAQSLIHLSDHVPEMNVYVTYGNHARVIPNKSESIHRDNFERIIPWWLEQRLGTNSNINIIEDNGTEFITVVSCGFGFVAMHGDLDNMSTISNIISPLFKDWFLKTYDIPLAGVIMGDKHHFETAGGLGVRPFICGALCGSDDYANSKRLYSDPSQLLMIINECVGVDAVYTINC